MKITILCENQSSEEAGETCLAEWGFSMFIEKNGFRLLFDSGHTDVYKRNAERLGINLEDADTIVLSHHHWDHVGGMRYHGFKARKRLVTHPETIRKLPSDESEKIRKDFEVVASAGPLEISDGVYFLGEIPRRNAFETGGFEDDAMADDSAIAIKTRNGVVIITGCSHSGIGNICEYAKEVTGQKIHAVIGGFHLFENAPKTVDGTIGYFRSEKPDFLYPMHCIDFPTLARFHAEFGIRKFSTGEKIELSD